MTIKENYKLRPIPSRERLPSRSSTTQTVYKLGFFFKEEGLEPVIRQMYWNVNVVAFFSFLRFRSVYEPLHYLLTRESDVKTMRFISTDCHLLEYGRELQKVYDLTNMAASMDLFIPMELFVLDCAKIKEVRHVKFGCSHQRQWVGVYATPPPS